MTISALPDPPSRSDSATFATKADALLGALPTFVAEANAQSAQLNTLGLGAFVSTSATSTVVGTGSKSLTVETGKGFTAGQPVMIARTSVGSTYMAGQVTSYTSGTGALVVEVTASAGSGTYADWTVNISALAGNAHPDVQEFASNGTWTKPSGATFVMVELLGGGGGGASGARYGVASTECMGGGAGGGAAYVSRTYKASDLGATETINVGAGGTAGAARTVDSSDGVAGGAGGNTSFGTWLYGYGGANGSESYSSGTYGGNGGGGGGTASAGSGVNGGGPPISASAANGHMQVYGGGNANSIGAYGSIYGGGGGGGNANAQTPSNSGASFYLISNERQPSEWNAGAGV